MLVYRSPWCIRGVDRTECLL